MIHKSLIILYHIYFISSIIWSSPRGQDQPLLYLTGQPIVEGPGSCHYVSEVNTHNIKVSDGVEGEDENDVTIPLRSTGLVTIKNCLEMLFLAFLHTSNNSSHFVRPVYPTASSK